jgi:type IV pilus assembly protein PilV
MNRNQQEGVVLLEALLGIFIFSIGILALIGMQAVAVKNTIEAQYRTEAGFLANELIGQIWVSNASPAAFNTATSCTAAPCTTWVAKVQAMMPNATGALAPSIVVVGNQVTVTVSWQKAGETSSHNHQVVAQIVGASG